MLKPIGSMYAIYGNIYHQYTPTVNIYTSTMDPMGNEWGLQIWLRSFFGHRDPDGGLMTSWSTAFIWPCVFVHIGGNLCSLIVIVWFLKMIVSFWLKKCSIFFLFHFGMVFQYVSFHFLGISFHAKIETWRGGAGQNQKDML